MTAKTSPARRAAFLKALRATGNQTLAAERAKVSRSWVQLHRSTDPEFDDACRAAIAAAKESLRSAPILDLRQGRQVRGARGSSKPPCGWGYLDGEELVVRGTNGRRVQIARARLHQWTPRVEDRFLATLAVTCNVRAACAEVGMSVESAYKHRARWPAFAERWDEAVQIGYWRLDGALTAGAIALFDPPDPSGPPLEPAAPALAPMSVDDAIRLAGLYERRQREAARRRNQAAMGSGY